MDTSCPKYDIQKIFSAYNPSRPNAYAQIKGGPLVPCIRGTIYLYQLGEGSSFHGLHIHEVGDCSIGNNNEPFTAAKSHYNPSNVAHPMHAGDLPPILSANGIGILSTFTNRFTVDEVIGKSFILHAGYDDFTSQPAGNAGARWACGVIDYY